MCIVKHVTCLVKFNESEVHIYFSFRNFRDFGVLTADSTMWWKAGLSIAAVTALGILVAKVLQTTDKVK